MSAKLGRGSLLLATDETNMTLFEVLEPFVPREQDDWDMKKWRVPTLVLSIFGVTVY